MSQNNLVLNTSFKTRDQYAVLEHIGGHFSIQVACFIMLSVPMYTYYDTLNWNSCTTVNEKYMAVNNTKCKDEIYEYGVAYTEELLSKKDQVYRDCIQLVEDNDDCTMYFLAVRMQVLNLICIIGFILTNVYSSLERKHKEVLDIAKLTSKKANVDKSSTHNFFQAWAVITPTMLYVYAMFTLIVKFSSVANLYNVVKIYDQGTITADMAIEPAYRPRPFVSIIMFCTIDFVSQFASLSVLGFVNLFSACKSSSTDRLSDPEWRFNIKIYSVVLNIFVNNIVIVRLVEFEPQFTNFKFMVYIYYLDLFFVAVFMFTSTIMLWTKLCFNKIVRFDGYKDKFSLSFLIKCFAPFIKMRFAAVFIGCLYVVVFYRTGQGELPASRQVAYDWIEFQTLMIFGLGIFGLSMIGLTAKINLSPSLTRSSAKTEEDDEDGVKYDETQALNKILSLCLRVSFEFYVKQKLREQEKKTYEQQMSAVGDPAQKKPFQDKLDQLQKNSEQFMISEEADYNQEVERLIYGRVNDILKGKESDQWVVRETNPQMIKEIKQDLVSQITTEISEIKEISTISSVYAPDLRKRFGVFDEVYAEALLDSIVFSIHNTNEQCEALQTAVAAFIKYDTENPSEAEEAKLVADSVAEVDGKSRKIDDDMEMQGEAPAEGMEGDSSKKAKGSRFGTFSRIGKITTKNRAYYVTEVETYLNNIAKIMVFNHGAKLEEMLVVDEAKLKEEEIPAAKNKLLRVQPFAFDKINTDKATFKRPKKDKVILNKITFADEILGGENGFILTYNFDAAMSATKVDHKNKLMRYCELLMQFGEDPQKAREAEFDCSAEGGANHVLGALEIIEGEEDKNQIKNADGKEVDITDLKYAYCSECALQIVYPRWEEEDKTPPKDGIYAYYCRGFKKEGSCEMVYCISCSKIKILATISIVNHDEEDKYLALTPDIYSACFLSFITDSSQIPPQPLQDPMQQSAIFQKVQMCFALQGGICFLVLQSSFDNQFQKPDALFLMMQMLTAYLFHATALNDTKSAYLKLKYLYRNINKFDDSSVLSAYLVCGQQGFISILCETMNLIFLCKQTTFVDLVLNYVAFAGILAIDDEILESVRLSYQSLIAILEDPSLLKQLKLIKDNSDELTNDNEGGNNEKPKKAYVSVTFHVVRIFYKLVYFYLYPLMVIPLQIYLYKTFVDVSSESKGMTDFFGGIVDINSNAVEELVAEQMYNKDDFKLYLFKVIALVIALYPLFLSVAPIAICIEHFKKQEAAEQSEVNLEDNSLNQPLLVNDSMIQGEDEMENDQGKKTNKCIKTSNIFVVIFVLSTLVLYPFWIVKVADLFLWLMKYEYGAAVVYTCALIVLELFFNTNLIEILMFGIPQLILFPILISKCAGAAYFLFLTKWGLSWVVSVTMMAPFLGIVIQEITKNACVAMIAFIASIAGGPFFWYYLGFTGLYYVTLWPAYWILYFIFVLVPYWLLVIPGSYIVLGVQKLFAYLLSFGVFKSVVTGGGNTLYTMVSVPFIEFVYKPIQFIFGKDKAQYAIGLVMIPFAIVCFVAFVSMIINKIETAQAEKAKQEQLQKIAEMKKEEEAQIKKDS